MDDRTPVAKRLFRQAAVQVQAVGQMIRDLLFSVDESRGFKMDQIPGCPEENLPTACFIRGAVFMDPLGTDSDDSVIHPENTRVSDTHRNDGVIAGD